MPHMEYRDRVEQTSDAQYAAWNAHDPDAFVATYAEDAELFDVTSGITTKGRDMIRALAVDSFVGIPDVCSERQWLMVEGRRSAERWVMRGTHTGEYQGLPPTGNAIDVAGATFCDHDDDGRITHDTHLFDVPAFLRQLGVQ